ncbi:hypothetical protein Tco_0466590 [Tanacetum coccineum]
MTTLRFADTHNLVAFLTKSVESEGFEQIVDFLNAINEEQQLQALVDGKKIIITEATVRKDLQLEDADEKKKKNTFTAKRRREKRNRTIQQKVSKRSFMCTYLKNIEGWKPKDLKNKSFANIQDLFNKAMKRVNTFVDMDTELVKESFKKAEAEIAQKSSQLRAREALG